MDSERRNRISYVETISRFYSSKSLRWICIAFCMKNFVGKILFIMEFFVITKFVKLGMIWITYIDFLCGSEDRALYSRFRPTLFVFHDLDILFFIT